MNQTDRKSSRRSAQRAARQRRRLVRATALGVLTLGLVAVVAVLALNLLSDGNGAKPTAWSAAPYTGGPRLAVDRTLVDEGSVPYNHEVKAAYHVKNVGDQPLTFQTPTVDVVEGC